MRDGAETKRDLNKGMAKAKQVPFDPKQKDKLDKLVLPASSEVVRKQRRNLLLVSTVSLFIVFADVSPSDARESSPGESHPQALAEPYVNVSAHTAPIIQPRVEGQVVASGQTGWALVERDVPASIPPAGDDLVTACISAGPTTEVVS